VVSVVCVVCVVVAQVAAGLSGSDSDLVPLNWVLLAACGVVCFLTASRPVRQWLPLELLVVGAAVAVASWRHGTDPAVLGRVGGMFYALVGFQATLLMFTRARSATAGVMVRAARAEVDLAAERAAAVAIRLDRQLRLRQLADGPLPLLADIGAGVLDPRDPDVRRRCVSSASALRRTLNRQLRPAAMVAALEPAVRAAEQRGARVEVQVAGDAEGIPPSVTGEAVRVVDGIMAGLGAGRVLVTLLGDGRGGSLVVTFTAPDPDPDPEFRGSPFPGSGFPGPGSPSLRFTGPGSHGTGFPDPESSGPGFPGPGLSGTGFPGPGTSGPESLGLGFRGTGSSRTEVPAWPPADTPWVDVVHEVEDGRACVEVRWGSARLAGVPA
jgi:hypothetical protein